MIGFVVPLKKEAWRLVEHLEGRAESSLEGHPLYAGAISGIPCRVVVSGCGKARSAAATHVVIDAFDCSKVIHFGSAGALSPRLAIGDVVVGERLVDWGPNPAPASFGDPALGDRFMEWAAAHDLRAIRGAILSGDEEVATAALRDELFALHGGLSVDWESAACARICNLAKVPVLVLRAITDLACETTHREFATNIAEASRRLGDAIAGFVAAEIPAGSRTRVGSGAKRLSAPRIQSRAG